MHPLAISLLIIQAAVPNDNDDLRSPLYPSPSFCMENMQHGWSERQGAAYLSATAREFKIYKQPPEIWAIRERGGGGLSRESDRERERVREEEKEEEDEEG
jgi:hypothetical protein